MYFRQINKWKKELNMKKCFLVIYGCFLLLAGCMSNEPQKNSTQEPKQIPEESLLIADYYPLENKVYSFQGEGNEFAAYTETFYEKTDQYLPSIVENGGTRIFKVYQLSPEGINVVYELPEYYEETLPSIDSIRKEFNPIGQLKSPLEIGTTFEGWQIVEVNGKAMLPIGEIEKIIVVEKRDEENHTVIRRYWAAGYGKVKEEFIFTEGEEEYKVISELKDIQ
jgi:hypothetical protein